MSIMATLETRAQHECLNPQETSTALEGFDFNDETTSRAPDRRKYWMCCSRQRKLQKYVLLVLLVLILALSAVTITTYSYLYHKFPGISSIKDGQCHTEECIRAAVRVRGLLNNSIDPCDDFYEYACGGWNLNNPIPQGWPKWNPFYELANNNYLNLSKFLENSREFKSRAEEKARMLYITCVDANGTIETRGTQPILDLIANMGGWNISTAKGIKFNASTLSLTSLQKTVHMMKKYADVDSFFSINVGPDDVNTKNSSNYILKIHPLQQEFFSDAYLKYMIEVGKLLEADEDSLRQQMKAIIDFHNQLYKIPSNYTPTAMKLSELQETSPFINWIEYCQEVIPVSLKQITSDEVVGLYYPEYFVQLSEIISSYLNKEEKRIALKNFLVWRVVDSVTEYLPQPFVNAKVELKQKTFDMAFGRSGKYCAKITSDYLGFAVSALFVHKVLDDNAIQRVEAMFNGLRETFKDQLRTISWLSQKEKQILKNKADAMTSLIGFPNFILDVSKLNKHYSNLNIQENVFFENVLRAKVHHYQQQFALLAQHGNESSWLIHPILTPMKVEATYRKTTNEIVVPAGLLLHPTFEAEKPNIFTFGSLGFVLGHEFMHAFDHTGIFHDENGNFVVEWRNHTWQKFKATHNCVCKQYASYSSSQQCNTLNEDLADIGGLRLAYDAFLNWLMKNEPLSLPGLPFSSKQLFFVTYAQMWCSSNKNDQHSDQAYYDRHSHFFARVIGPICNMPEFAQEFQCKLGSKMNPPTKCKMF